MCNRSCHPRSVPPGSGYPTTSLRGRDSAPPVTDLHPTTDPGRGHPRRHGTPRAPTGAPPSTSQTTVHGGRVTATPGVVRTLPPRQWKTNVWPSGSESREFIERVSVCRVVHAAVVGVPDGKDEGTRTCCRGHSTNLGWGRVRFLGFRHYF